MISDNKKNKLDGILFRKEPVDIDSGTGKAIHRGLHPEEKIIDALTTALEILNDAQTPFLIRLAVFHYFFEYIHPFYDGNGRTGRFIVSYYLAEHFHYLAALRLSVTIKKNQKQYYELFKETSAEINCGDLTPFVLGFISIIEETFGEVENMLTRQSAQLEQYRQILKHKLPPDELTQKIGYLLLQAVLFYGGGIPMGQLMEITGASRNTIKDRLRSLPSSYVIQSGSRKLFYKLNLKIFAND